MNERIVINGSQITDDDFLDIFGYVMEKVEEMEAENLPHPTFFEFLFGMAMTAFDRAGVEYIVLETGLGDVWTPRCDRRPLNTVLSLSD